MAAPTRTGLFPAEPRVSEPRGRVRAPVGSRFGRKDSVHRAHSTERTTAAAASILGGNRPLSPAPSRPRQRLAQRVVQPPIRLLEAPPPLARAKLHFIPPPLLSSAAFTLAVSQQQASVAASIYNCGEVDDTAIYPLGTSLLSLQSLYFGLLPKVTSLGIERMVSTPPHGRWEKLTEAHFFDTPVSDKALGSLASFKSLTTVTLSHLECMTFVGLQRLIKGAPLRTLAIVKCPSIDVFIPGELQKTRPDMVICRSPEVDPTAVRWAIKEADEGRDRSFNFPYRFLGELFDGRKILEKDLAGLNGDQSIDFTPRNSPC